MKTLPYLVKFWAEGLSKKFNEVAHRYEIFEIVAILNRTRRIGDRKEVEKEEKERISWPEILEWLIEIIYKDNWD